MSLEKDVREVLGEASVQYKKLDQLVRQGMMSPAALPILHRGLDKMQAGQVLNPQEREAVNKVLQSMLYIVTGDDTVFQKARQHTQRTKYQTESKEEYDNEGEMAKTQLTTLADAAQELMGMLSDNQNLPEWVQSKITKAVDYLDTARDYIKSEGDNGKAPVGEEADPDTVRMMMANPKMQKSAAMKGLNKKAQRDVKKAIKKRTPTMSESYKEKFAAAMKKAGKTLDQMSDEEKKKFFNDVDASHKAKNEEAVDEGAMSRMDYQQKSGEKGSGLKTFKKKPAPKDTMVASPKTQRVKMTTAKAAERMVKKGAVYAEDTVNEEDKTHIVQYHTKDGTHKNDSRVMTKAKATDYAKRGNMIDKVGGKYTVKAANEETVEEGYADSEEMRTKTQAKLKRMSKMKANQEKETDPGIKEDSIDEASAAEVLKKRYASNHPEDNPQATKIVKDAIPGVKTDKMHPHAGLTNRGYSKKGKMAALKKQHARRPAQYGITKEETVDEASAYADARRAMKADSKGLAPTKKDGGTKTYKGTKAGEERHGGHIVMQLRKAVSIGKPVKFKDGKEHKVSKADAHKFLSKYNSSKPADREKMHSGHNSHDDFQSHINK